MKPEHIAEIKKYAAEIGRANTEEAKKLRFTSLLNRLFQSPQAKVIIDRFSEGAEQTVLNIQRIGKVSDKGRADSQYQRVIIEFENDLKKTEKHAKEQLQEYVSGNWNSGETYNFTLISSDCAQWIVYAPDIETTERLKTQKKIASENVTLIEKDRITISEKNAEDFYYFLDTYLFKSERQKATLSSIQRDFGQSSETFISCYGYLYDYFQSVKDTGEVKVAFEQWRRFLSIAYGKFDASERIFIIHSYLSIFAKMLAYEIITRDDHIDDNELKGIITGSIFESKNIRNFTDNDFFHWVGSETAFPHLKKAFRAIAAQIDSNDFSNVDEDILKGVYQELIDRDTRQSLGEYYTPDWLCERIVDSLDIQKTSKLIDPSCGSGSFLRAAIDQFKGCYPDLTADQIANQICGIDIHPLSVLIAKTTVLLALGGKIQEAKNPIHLNIYLADTLLTPTGSVNLDLLGDEFNLWIDDKQYSINTSVFNNVGTFDDSVTIAEQLAEITKADPPMDQKAFEKALSNKVQGISGYLINSFYNIYRGLKRAKEENRDSIWKFIVMNLYKPCFYHKHFDFVIGNPPWFTYSAIGNSSYQARLKQLAGGHNLVPNVANMPHLEIAAIFLTHCTNYFLNDKGKLAFVLPRSFFSADHHDNTRSGKAQGIRITDVWDLDAVSPLFNVPSCVLFTERASANLNKTLPASGRDGSIFKGRLSAHNLNWDEAKDRITIQKKKFFYSKLGASSAFTNFKLKESAKGNYYKAHFKQGATIVPRNFYFVDITQEYKGDLKNRVLTVKSSASMAKDAKEPWKSLPPLEGRIHSRFLFRTAIARNILPFYLHNPELVLLPLRVNKDRQIEMLSAQQILAEGEIDTAKWFQNVERLWNENKTEKNKQNSAIDYLNWQKKLSGQNLKKRYVVIYTASGKDANATVVDRAELDLDFTIDYKSYFFCTKDRAEAHYLCAFLNANEPNEVMKSFQSRGLFGARDVSKKILEVPFPQFDKTNKDHMALAELGRTCIEKTAFFIKTQSLSNVLGGHELGKARLAIKGYLKKELKAIDSKIKEIVEG